MSEKKDQEDIRMTILLIEKIKFNVEQRYIKLLKERGDKRI